MIESLKNSKEIFFSIDLVIHYILLGGIVWSVLFYEKRIWPPPGRKSWQYTLTWFLFYAAFGLNAVLMVLDWNNWVLGSAIRFLLGIPVLVVGVILFLWGFTTLGAKNTSGVQDGFHRDGAYRFTRNPQYLGDMLLFAGLAMVSNSLYLLVVNALLALVFLLTPFSEEVWLEEQYDEAYLAYKRETPRFF